MKTESFNLSKESTIKKSENSNILPKKILFILILIFTMCSVKLCAEGMTPAEAQVKRETFVAEAKKYVGSPYILGATGPDSFDCSGLVYFVSRESIQLQLPRTARAIYKYCKIVSEKEREVGDLLFFKTNNSAPITHVGIYIGNKQFISAISDGPNTGVIISSLNQEYWKTRYVATGQILPPGIPGDEEKSIAKTNDKKSFVGSSYYAQGNKVKDSLVIDAAVFADWALFQPDKFMVTFRGIDLMANIRMANIILEPGLGLGLRFNTGLKLFQIPLTLSITLNDYIRLYAGPIFSFGNGTMIGTGNKIKPSIFPGIAGVSFSTPALNIGKVGMQIVQDISYSIFNNMDNSALSFCNSISAGFVFYSGIRVIFGNKIRK